MRLPATISLALLLALPLALADNTPGQIGFPQDGDVWDRGGADTPDRSRACSWKKPDTPADVPENYHYLACKWTTAQSGVNPESPPLLSCCGSFACESLQNGTYPATYGAHDKDMLDKNCECFCLSQADASTYASSHDLSF